MSTQINRPVPAPQPVPTGDYIQFDFWPDIPDGSRSPVMQAPPQAPQQGQQ